MQRPKRILHQCAYRTGRDHHHVLELPRVVSNEQDAVAQVWQQEQGRWLQDQVARDGPRDEPNRTCHSAYQSGARLCDWHVFRLVEPGSAAEIASALVRSFEHRVCALSVIGKGHPSHSDPSVRSRLPIVNRIVRIVTGHADALAGPTASGNAGRGEAGRPQDCA